MTRVFFIDNVAVHRSNRGRGLGRILLRLAEDQARRAGFDSIYLYTHEKMTRPNVLYRSESGGWNSVNWRPSLVTKR